MTIFLNSLVKAGAVAVAVLATSAAHATTVDWRAGSGNTGEFFTTATGSLGGETIELGLRARIAFIGDVTPQGNVYTFDAGPSTVNPSRAIWNFDIHVEYGGNISALDALTLELSSSNTNTPAAASFNLLDAALRAAIDCHIIGCVNGAPVNPDAGVADLGAGNDGAPTQNATNFYQASQNPVFGWYSPAFNFNLGGNYGFTLSATEGSESLSTSMLVSVVPEPMSIALFGIGLAGLGAVRRRRATKA